MLAVIFSPIKIPLPEVGGPLGAHSPSPTRRKLTDPLSRGIKRTPSPEASPSLREMPDSEESTVERVVSGQVRIEVWRTDSIIRTKEEEGGRDTFTGRIGTRPRGRISFKEKPPE